MNVISRQNNFDLIRILAALQVLFYHTSFHLEVTNVYYNVFAIDILKHFPGVPIFFVVSGFLVYWSFERNSDKLMKFFWHRALRIFPALWVCVLITLGLLICDLNLGWADINARVLAWLAGQFSFAQFYTPDLFRAWGVGTPNGSLWTIPVELQFYLLLPLMFFIFKFSKNRWAWVFAAIFIASIIANLFIKSLDPESLYRKLGNVFILSYLHYFLFGVLAYKNWNRIRKFFEGKFLIWLIAYGAYVLLFDQLLDLYGPSYWINNPYNFISQFLLAGLTLAFAFTNTSLSKKMLKGNDFSYGMYIYHMLVVNFLVQRDMITDLRYVSIAFIFSFILAAASWLLIEKKALKLKSLLK